MTALDVYLIVGDPNSFTDLFRMASSTSVIGLPYVPLPREFRVSYLGFVFGNMLAVMLFEYFVVLGPVRNMLRKAFHREQLTFKL